VLDGVDLDIEGGGVNGYGAFIDEMRAIYHNPSENPSNRQYLITGAPQCPFPDAHMGASLASSWYDYVFVQFYNNYCGASSPANFNFNTWADW
jgi:chitinase